MSYRHFLSTALAASAVFAPVREVQTLSMPITMMQVLLFLFASLAVGSSGQPIEWAAVAFPFSSPFAMFARAAQFEDLWPHLLALAWQSFWVAVTIKLGAGLFRKRVMKSGGQATRVRNRNLKALQAERDAQRRRNAERGEPALTDEELRRLRRPRSGRR